MINTLSEMLEAFIEKERQKLNEFVPINHGPMIGDMYEGLSRKVLGLTLFKGLNLRVVEGKICNSKQQMSRQIDCMLVEGEGIRIPHTTHFIYPVQQVIAVVEVNKTLYGDDLDDAFSLMYDLRERIYEPSPMREKPMRDAWRGITRTQLPEHAKVTSLPFEERVLYHTLLTELNLPLRMILGYNGYTSEYGLRAGMLKYLEARLHAGLPARGVGPLSLPNLILCPKACIVKLSGLPFNGPFVTPDWSCVASRGTQPVRVLLELLWSRLSYRYGLGSAMFGDDLDCEVMSLLLKARPLRRGSVTGWDYSVSSASKSALAAGRTSAPWEPKELTLEEFVVMNRLCAKDGIAANDPEFLGFLNRKGLSYDVMAKALQAKGLACDDDGRLRLLTDSCGCVILPDGRYVAAENKSGRLLRWLSKSMNNWRKVRPVSIAPQHSAPHRPATPHRPRRRRPAG